MDNRSRRTPVAAALLVALLLVVALGGAAGARPAGPAAESPPVFLRSWGGEGNVISRPGGMAIAGTMLTIANLELYRITRHDLGSRAFTTWGGFGVAPGSFSGRPSSVAFDSAGNLYVSDLDHQVQVFNSAGQFVRAWGERGPALGQLREPTDLDIYQDRIYVVERDNHRVQVFSSAGVPLFIWGGVGDGDGQFRRPSGIAVDPRNGTAYVVDSQNLRIQAFDANGNYLRQWGSPGTGPGQFSGPRKIAVDGNGLVYVADLVQSRVQVFEPDGSFVGAFGQPGSGVGQFQEAVGIEVDETANNNVYVGDRTRVQRFIRLGSGWVPDRVYGRESSERLRPAGIVLAANGLVYATDARPEAFALLISDRYGNRLASWPLGAQPEDLTLDAAGNVYIAQPAADRVVQYAPFDPAQPHNAVVVREWLGFNQPLDVAVDGLERLLVADALNNRVQRFDVAGNPELSIGEGQLTEPSSVAVDSQGVIYAFDQGLMRVVTFDAAGSVLGGWGGEGTGDGQFTRINNLAEVYNAPHITIHGDDVFVTDPGGGRVQRFTRDGVFVLAWGQEGSGAGQFAQASDIAVDGGPDVFVADSENRRIQVFRFGARTTDPVTGLALNGDMEATPALTGWGISLAAERSLPTSRQPGSVPGWGGNSVMRLGQPVAAVSQGTTVAWASQVVYVDPSLTLPVLAFAYHIRTNTTIDWSDFYVEIQDATGVNRRATVLRAGHPGPADPAAGTSLGWRNGGYDLTPFRGQTIRIVFMNRNLHQASRGIWTELDNVRIIDLSAYTLYNPVIADN